MCDGDIIRLWIIEPFVFALSTAKNGIRYLDFSREMTPEGCWDTTEDERAGVWRCGPDGG